MSPGGPAKATSAPPPDALFPPASSAPPTEAAPPPRPPGHGRRGGARAAGRGDWGGGGATPPESRPAPAASRGLRSPRARRPAPPAPAWRPSRPPPPAPSGAGPPGWHQPLRALRGALPPDVGRETAELAALAGPVLLAFLTSVVSSVFCGHLGRVELDAVTLAVPAVNVAGISVGTGLAATCDTLMSQATFLFQLQAKYLQNQGSQGIITPRVVAGIAANVLHVGMNALLLFALDLGVVGSSCTNTTSQFFLSALLFLYAWWKRIHVSTWGGWTRDCFQEWGSFIQLAIPSMFMVCTEWWTSEIRTFLAGLMSVTELGARAIIYVLVSAAYVVPLGFGVTASVQAGNALGVGSAQQARHSCITVLLCTGVCVLAMGILLAAFKDVVAYAFTSDKDIISLVSRVIPVFVPFHLFVALAVSGVIFLSTGTSGGVLRGAGKQKMGAFLNAIGYYVFGFPLGASLMFAANCGITGPWSGLMVRVFFQTVFYLVYLWRINWNRAAEQAQIRAWLQGMKEAVPIADLSILEKEVPEGVILPDVI